jgi:cytochrome c oxidase subunit 2
MFSPATEQAELIVDLTLLVTGICAVILAVVWGILFFTVVRYRRASHHSEGDPPQVYGSGPIELAWTVVPMIIVVVLALVSARGIFDIDRREPPPNSMPINIVGHQWWWEFEYPELGIVTAGEMVVPVSDPENPRPMSMRLESADVIHSFWVPRLAGKIDVFPNHVNTLWFDPQKTGTYYGQCAEYCGNQHANMLIRVIVKEQDDWEAWVKNQQKPGVQDPAVADGRETFMQTACMNCHRIRGTRAEGTFAPDLTHLMSRSVIGSGIVMNTRDNLRQWILNPQVIKPGCNMPAMKLEDAQIELILDYLETLQ